MCGKNEVRQKLKIARRLFQGVARESADGAVFENFMAAYSSRKSFFIYNSFADEADTKALSAALYGMGKRVCLPRVEGENIVPAPYGDKMKKGAFGVFEPLGQAVCADFEVTVVPLLAVNSRGYRVGYGKGFYDRYLSAAKTLKVGLGYYFQLEDFDEDGWDQPLDAFVCERGIFYFGEEKSSK